MHSDKKTDFLKSFPFFLNSSAKVVDDISGVLRPQRFTAQQSVFRVGDVCGVIAFLLSGRIRVYAAGAEGREITLYDVEEGQVCILNAACILCNQSYPALATVTQDGTALMMTADDFRRVVDEHPDMRNYIYSGLGSRLLNMMGLVQEVAFRKLDKRLIELLERRSENGVLASTHQNIANELGTSREIISRLLEDMEQRGMVKLSRNQITVVKLS